jgi:hypothetical protein
MWAPARRDVLGAPVEFPSTLLITGEGSDAGLPRPAFLEAFPRLAWRLLVFIELNGAPDRLLVAPLARPTGNRFRVILWSLAWLRVFLASFVRLVLLAKRHLLFHGGVLLLK